MTDKITDAILRRNFHISGTLVLEKIGLRVDKFAQVAYI